jgi:hypothetical protein
VERLPKPKNVAGALQPLFEAISNGIHSTQEKFGDSVSENGLIIVDVKVTRAKDNVTITVEDNGVGLDQRNWNSFTTTDTDNKLTIGGKGVGRLLWLDCFRNISVSSIFYEDDNCYRREFSFSLNNDDQIENEVLEALDQRQRSMFFVKFEGLRANEYGNHFPGRGHFFFQHLTAHFLPVFIGNRCPIIEVHVGDETRRFPDAISHVVIKRPPEIEVRSDEFGVLLITLMECDSVASSGMKGAHFIHFIGHDRTVLSQSIDSKLGLKAFGPEGNLVFHAIVKGEFLDKNVNQERTAFNFEDSIIEKIINDVCFSFIEDFLSEPLLKLRGEQRKKIELIASTYPSVAFGDSTELQGKVPSGELKEDAIYGHLARERYRRDEKQAAKVRDALKRLKDSGANVSNIGTLISDATKALEDAEQRSLAEYVVRRKVVLDFMEILLNKSKFEGVDSDYQREDILHSFICPMKVNTVNGRRKIESASSHDLWIIDERLTFAQYFSSDEELGMLLDKSGSEERPDVIVFDHVHGLRQTDSNSRVLLVEFKRPGRKSYKDDENPQLQVERYVRKLLSGGQIDVKGRPVKLDTNTIFYCYIIADIVGKLDEWSFSWQRTADGRGRIYRPNNGFNGAIELIGWDDLLSDARERNKAFFDRVGISGRSFFNPE